MCWTPPDLDGAFGEVQWSTSTVKVDGSSPLATALGNAARTIEGLTDGDVHVQIAVRPEPTEEGDRRSLPGSFDVAADSFRRKCQSYGIDERLLRASRVGVQR